MDDRTALRLALGDFLLALPPEVAERVAVACLRLAAACYSISQAARREGPTAAATELLLILADSVELPQQESPPSQGGTTAAA